jgi:hypothetical protein
VNRKLLLALFFVLVSMPFSDVSADLIVFKTGQDTTGNNLDGIKNDTGLPTTVNVAEIAGLTLTVVDISSDSAVVDQLNATATSFGVDAINVGVGGSDDSDQFDSSLNESVVFRFNQDVVINSVDFFGFNNSDSSTDVFSFASTTINGFSDQLGSGDVFTFTGGLAIAANTDFTVRAVSGSIGFEDWDVTVTAVPEPGSIAILCALCGGFWVRRRYFSKKKNAEKSSAKA